MYLHKLTTNVINEFITMSHGEKTACDVVETINRHIDKFIERVTTRDEVARYVGSYIRKNLKEYADSDLVASAIESEIVRDKTKINSAKNVGYGMRNLDQIAHEYLRALEPVEVVSSMNSAWFIMFIAECQARGVVDPKNMTLGQVAEIMEVVSARYMAIYGDC